MSRPTSRVVSMVAVALLTVGCQEPGLQGVGSGGQEAAFDTEATRLVRRAGMTDDRPVNTVAASTAWATLVRRRVLVPTTVEVLVLAGGGGGGGSTAGGGGGGGMIYQSGFTLTAGTAYGVVVGGGGQGSNRASIGPAINTNGGDSRFGSLVAIGGGYGAMGRPSGSRNANSGGSGGGGGYYYGNDLIPVMQAAGTAGQGNAGGVVQGTSTAYWGGGGGGGAGGPGAGFDREIATGGGNGGPGLACAISGTSTYYAGGGGGGIYVSGFTLGGIGGGGNGADGQTYTAQAGATNTGGGGGGGGYYQYGPGGGNGGSGIVIVKYLGATQASTGGTKTVSGGYTTHTFTTMGAATFTTP